MRRINEKDFVSFTISCSFNVTFFKLETAMKEWVQIQHGTLYGNKPDGTRAILDSKL